MNGLRRFVARLASSLVMRQDEDRMREELEAHLALQTDENRRAGLPPDEARRQALLKFGAVETVKEHYRDEQRLPLLEQAVQDVRYTFRQLRKAPIFTITATLSLAAGIGANAAVFTLIDRLLLRALPVTDPNALVFVIDQGRREASFSRFSYPFYLGLRENGVLKGVTAQYAMSVNAYVDQQPERARTELVSGTYFSVLGTDVQLGRPLSPADDRTPGAHSVAVISDRLWRRALAADPSVLGRALRINDHAFTIVGVAGTGFTGTEVGNPTDIWVPLVMQREVGRNFLADADTNWLEVVGRLAPGTTAEQAGSALTEFVEHTGITPSAASATSGHRIVLRPGGKGNSPVRRELGHALRVLQALTGLALVLACVNLASLLAVRAAGRQKEIAVRLALGARRSRLARQFLTETLVLAALGGTAGMLIAPWAAGLLIASQPDRLGIDPSLDLRVFLFGVAVSVSTGLLVGQVQVLASTSARRIQAVGPGRSFGLRRWLGVHDLLVTCQMALSLAMLISAALLVQSVRGLGSVDPGFQADNLLLVSADPAAAGYDRPRIEDFWRRTVERVSQIRGVQNVSLARTVPLAPGRQRQPLFDATVGAFVEIDTNFVGPQYFRTLGIPILRGREFGDEDGRTSRPVVIVNDRLARMLWPDQDPIGKGVRFARDRQDLQHKGPMAPPRSPLPEVIGVVRDAKYHDLRGEAEPMLYKPYSQSSSSDAMAMHVRATRDAAGLAQTIRREIEILDANVPLFGIGTLEDQLDASFAQTRQAAVLTGAFGALALLLSGVGVYGVTALAVSRRTQEIGIRMALGARPSDIVRAISRRGLILVFVGLGLGLAGSFAFTRVAGALLFGVTPSDATTFVGMSLLLIVVSVAAIYVPAVRATRLDTVGAIRCE